MKEQPEDLGFAPGAEVLDTAGGAVGTVLELGDEQALVRFSLLGDCWVPYGELLPGGGIVGLDP